MTSEVSMQRNMPASLETMLQDMGIDDPEIREATKAYCLGLLEGERAISLDPEVESYTGSEMKCIAWGFVEGYEAALKRNA